MDLALFRARQKKWYFFSHFGRIKGFSCGGSWTLYNRELIFYKFSSAAELLWWFMATLLKTHKNTEKI